MHPDNAVIHDNFDREFLLHMYSEKIKILTQATLQSKAWGQRAKR